MDIITIKAPDCKREAQWNDLEFQEIILYTEKTKVSKYFII